MIRIYDFDKIDPRDILNRDIRAEEDVNAAVDAILADVRQNGDAALLAYAKQFDGAELDSLLDFLVKALTQAPSVPLSGKRMVNVDMCLDIIEDIRNCLPDAVRYSQQIVDNRDRLIREAQIESKRTINNAQAEANAKVQAADARANSAIEDATRRAQSMVNDAENRANQIIEEAHMRARAMIEQSEIMRHAHDEAAQLCNDARAEANEQRLQASRYAEELLRELERDIQSTLDAVHRSIKNVSGT